MKMLRNKWVLFGAFVVLIGAGTAFLMDLTSLSSKPSTGRAAPPPQPLGVQTPDHELKELGVQLEKKPGHVPVLMRMAQIERDKGKLDEAAAHLREALKAEPANNDVHLELGRVLYEKGDIGGAIAETRKVLAADPKQVDALYNLGAIYANLGNSQQARSYWTKAVEVGAAADSGKKAREALARLGGS